MTFLLKAIKVRQRGDWLYENYMEVTSQRREIKMKVFVWSKRGTTEETVSPVSHIQKD